MLRIAVVTIPILVELPHGPVTSYTHSMTFNDSNVLQNHRSTMEWNNTTVRYLEACRVVIFMPYESVRR